MEWMLMPLKRYADFSGRSRRKEYWMFTLGSVIVSVILYGIIGASIGLGNPEDTGSLALMSGAGIILLIFAVAIFIPSLAVQVRRFHDQDKSGWFILLNLVPYVGWIVVLVMMCIDGTRGPNRFGADPKGEDHSQIFACALQPFPAGPSPPAGPVFFREQRAASASRQAPPAGFDP